MSIALKSTAFEAALADLRMAAQVQMEMVSLIRETPMATAAQLQQAREAHYDALVSGADVEVVNRLGRELAALQRENETIDQRAARLEREASALEQRALDADAEAAQDDLVIKVRRERWGADDSGARDIEARAKAGRSCAADDRAEAARLRSQVAAIRRSSMKAA